MKKNKQVIPFDFKPWSKKQKQVLAWWAPESPVKNKDGIIADGSIRAGKTIAMSISFVDWAEYTFKGQNLAFCGKTIGSLRRNVIQPLKRMLKARNIPFNDHRAENYITIGHNDYYMFGGKDESSQDLIQGITLAGVFFDEVALQVESFVQQAIGRCSVDGSKYWFNCNPAGPYHWFKQEWIDKAKEKNILHLHFTMDDNLTLSQAIKQRYANNYTGVFFKRYILGLWVMAEGIIYDMFDEEKHLRSVKQYLKELSEKKGREVTLTEAFPEMYVCIDYGTENPCTFALHGYNPQNCRGYELPTVQVIKEYWWDARKQGRQKTDKEYADDLEKFTEGLPGLTVYLDPSAASFKVELRRRNKWSVRDANNDVLDGIRFMSSMLGSGKLLTDPECTETRREYYAYSWDAKAAERGEDKPLKVFDHSKDRDRYGTYTRFKNWFTHSAQEEDTYNAYPRRGRAG